MFIIKIVGLIESTHGTLESALTTFKAEEAKGSTYGNRYLQCPDGSVVNVWDIREKGE